ncbi:hypothetical protein K457DRAFT_49478, partial [Linnemannia elongata AG-77]
LMRIATLNVRGMRKQHLQRTIGPNNQSNFYTWLRQTDNNILALQELGFDSPGPNTNQQQTLNQILNCNDAVWTRHCALLIRDPSLSITSSSTFLDGRVITASIMSSSLAFEATICVMYADANPTDRKQFFLDCLSLPFFLSPPQYSFLLGDLNYQHHHSRPHPEFQDWVNSHLVDCITPPHAIPSTTF